MQNSGYDYAKKFFDENNASSYDNLVKIATFYQDNKWKKEIIKSVPEKSIVLDLACGTGILSDLLAKGENIVYGLDLTFQYLKVMQAKRQYFNCVNGTAEILPYRNNSFDVIVSSYLPKYVNLNNLIEECRRVLKQNGIIVLHDFTYPDNFLFSKIWRLYFKILRFCGKFVKTWQTVFNELDTLIINSKWHESLQNILNKHEFINIHSKYYTFGTSAIVSAVKRG